jgi:hypothetical protein
MTRDDGKRDADRFREVHAYERIAITRSGKRVILRGNVTPEYFAGLRAGGCKVR